MDRRQKIDKNRKCPYCDADDWDVGQVCGYVRVSYKKNFWAFGNKVEAMVCNECGYIELFRLIED